MKEAKEMITPAYTLLYEEELKDSRSEERRVGKECP